MNQERKLTIAIDFDGTIVTHAFPKIGDPVPLALETIKELIALGHQIMIWTMRSDNYLVEAYEYLEKNIPENQFRLIWFNTNPTQKEWSKSNKQYADLYIDDAAYGCPLRKDKEEERLFVDWRPIRRTLLNKN